MYRLPKETTITPSILTDYLAKHRRDVTERYDNLYKAYISDHEILHQPPKPKYKPQNKVVVNFPKYITDTMNGFFIGNPIKTTADDESVSDYVEFLDQYNDQDDQNAELSKICSIYGSGFEMYYVDEDSELCITYLNPMEAFMIYDESIIERPLFFVRRYTDNNNVEWGSISDKTGVRHFRTTGGFQWIEDDWVPHHFGGVPATEYLENAERQGIFEPVMPMVNAFNKAISEKANDVDYFADAYMKILGALVDSEDIDFIRDNRIINLAGEDAEKIIVDFLEKPSNDAGQENLLNRLERLIFQISMVANISDENFGGSSGIALQYKLQAMKNLAKTKERKFTSGMNRRYKILFSHPLSKVPADAWVQLKYKYTPNIPANMLEEAQIAAQMEGITSHKTQLRVLSIVDNVEDELDEIAEENAPDEESLVERMTFGSSADSAHSEGQQGEAEMEQANEA